METTVLPSPGRLKLELKQLCGCLTRETELTAERRQSILVGAGGIIKARAEEETRHRRSVTQRNHGTVRVKGRTRRFAVAFANGDCEEEPVKERRLG